MRQPIALERSHQRQLDEFRMARRRGPRRNEHALASRIEHQTAHRHVAADGVSQAHAPRSLADRLDRAKSTSPHPHQAGRQRIVSALPFAQIGQRIFIHRPIEEQIEAPHRRRQIMVRLHVAVPFRHADRKMPARHLQRRDLSLTRARQQISPAGQGRQLAETNPPSRQNSSPAE